MEITRVQFTSTQSNRDLGLETDPRYQQPRATAVAPRVLGALLGIGQPSRSGAISTAITTKSVHSPSRS